MAMNEKLKKNLCTANNESVENYLASTAMEASLRIVRVSRLHVQRVVDGSVVVEPLDCGSYNDERNNSLPLVFMRDEGGIHSGMRFDLELHGNIPHKDMIGIRVEPYYADNSVLPIPSSSQYIQIQPESHRRFSADGKASLVIRLLKLSAKDCGNRCFVLRFICETFPPQISDIKMPYVDSAPIKVMSKNTKQKRKHDQMSSIGSVEQEAAELRSTVEQLQAENAALRDELRKRTIEIDKIKEDYRHNWNL